MWAKMWLHQLCSDARFVKRHIRMSGFEMNISQSIVTKSVTDTKFWERRSGRGGLNKMLFQKFQKFLAKLGLKPRKFFVCSDKRNPFVSPPRSKIKMQTVDVKKITAYGFVMSKAIYKENCFPFCNLCSISLKFYFQFYFLSLTVLGNKKTFSLRWHDFTWLTNTLKCAL